jgi:deoxycytidylate deaminase
MKKVIFMALFAVGMVADMSAQFTTNQWYGPYNWWGWVQPATTDYANDLFRQGGIGFVEPCCGDGRVLQNKGITFYQGGMGIDDVWGHHNYGLTLANFDKFNLSQFDSYASNSVTTALSGWGGLAMRSQYGALLVHQNGIVSVGLNMDWHKAKLRELSKKANSSGDVSTGFMLYVRQGIVTERVQVATMTNWPDYVFKKGYDLLPLSKVADFIQEKGHLPNTLSAETIEKEGIELGATAKNQQEKIEEIFLHLIEMEKRVKALEAENASLKHALNNR